MVEIRKAASADSEELNYLTQQSIFSSSLSQDITEFDMTHNVVRRHPVDHKTKVVRKFLIVIEIY